MYGCETDYLKEDWQVYSDVQDVDMRELKQLETIET